MKWLFGAVSRSFLGASAKKCAVKTVGQTGLDKDDNKISKEKSQI